MKIIKATHEEQATYQTTNPIYPLFGFIKTKQARIPVEYLGEGRGEPNYEALAPDGKMFFPDGTHTLLGVNQADLLERVASNDLVDDTEVGQ